MTDSRPLVQRTRAQLKGKGQGAADACPPSSRRAREQKKKELEEKKAADKNNSLGPPASEPVAGAGWTPHNKLVLQQHTTYMELEVKAGIVSKGSQG